MVNTSRLAYAGVLNRVCHKACVSVIISSMIPEIISVPSALIPIGLLGRSVKSLNAASKHIGFAGTDCQTPATKSAGMPLARS